MRVLPIAALCLLAGGLFWLGAPESTKYYTVRVVKSFPHDPQAYTQGLLFRDGHLYESTGREHRSSVRQVELETGKVLKKHDLLGRYFGEGLAFDGRRFVQLTWQSGKAFLYDTELEQVGEFSYGGEGWGLAFDGKSLIVSDGTEKLHFLNPETFELERSIRVLDEGLPIARLNELEVVKGEIWANVWKRDLIAAIDPADGAVLRWIDISGLFDYRKLPDAEAVPNGIAWDPDGQRLFLTGKLWPKLFEVEVVPVEKPR